MVVSGLRRQWGAVDRNRKYNALAVVEDEDAWCNGLLVEVSASDVLRLDLREKGYIRIRIEREQIQYLGGGLRAGVDDEVWVYAMRSSDISMDYCLIQSYIDLVIAGLIDIGGDAVRLFFESCDCWDEIEDYFDDRGWLWWERFHNENDRASEIDEQIRINYAGLLDRRVDRSLVRKDFLKE